MDAIWEPEVEVIVILDQHSLVVRTLGEAHGPGAWANNWGPK